MSDEVKTDSLPPEHVTKLRAVVKDMEDGLESLESLPEHVAAWIKAKVEALKAHL